MRPASLFVALVLAACDGAASRGPTSSSNAAGTGAGSTGGAGTVTVDGGQGGATGACGTCDGTCVDTANDPRHCGACGHACAPHTLCDHGACAIPLCLVVGLQCPNDHVCCGDACCPPWEMCCNEPGVATPVCAPLDAGACPTACTGCP